MTTRPTMGDRLREVADRLTAEREVQIKATARILGAAAQIAQNHDRLISEVSEMVQGDLARAWDVDRLKREFGTLKAACAHFGKTARRWQDLAVQVAPATPIALLPPASRDLEDRVQSLQTQVHHLQAQVATLQRAIEQLQGGDSCKLSPCATRSVAPNPTAPNPTSPITKNQKRRTP